MRMSQFAVVIWSVCMAIIATGISQTSIGVNYLVTCMGVFTCCAVFPIYSTVLWKRQNRIAVVVAPVLGSVTAIASWLGSAYALEGAVTVDTTSQILPLVIGNATSLLSGAIYSIICTFLFGKDTFDWQGLAAGIIVVDDSDIPGLTAEQLAEQTAKEHLTPEVARALKRGKMKAILIAMTLCFIFVIIWVGLEIPVMEYVLTSLADANVRHQLHLLETILPLLGRHYFLVGFWCCTDHNFAAIVRREEDTINVLALHHWEAGEDGATNRRCPPTKGRRVQGRRCGIFRKDRCRHRKRRRGIDIQKSMGSMKMW